MQLTDNSRQWGKERADLQIRMNENEHGFGRSGGMVLHDYPMLVRKNCMIIIYIQFNLIQFNFINPKGNYVYML
jgi:hypothetical protein